MDIVANGKVGIVVATLEGQTMLSSICKGDGSLAWVETQTCKGELFITLVYGDRRRSKRVDLWNWMNLNLSIDKWLICGDFNHTKFMEDLVGPSPLLHGLERRAWNHLVDRFDLLDNHLIVVIKSGPHFTRQALHGDWLDQSCIDRSYSNDRGH